MARPCSRPWASAFLCWLLIGRRPFRVVVERFESDRGVMCALVICLNDRAMQVAFARSLPRITLVAMSVKPLTRGSSSLCSHGYTIEVIATNRANAVLPAGPADAEQLEESPVMLLKSAATRHGLLLVRR